MAAKTISKLFPQSLGSEQGFISFSGTVPQGIVSTARWGGARYLISGVGQAYELQGNIKPTAVLNYFSVPSNSNAVNARKRKILNRMRPIFIMNGSHF